MCDFRRLDRDKDLCALVIYPAAATPFLSVSFSPFLKQPTSKPACPQRSLNLRRLNLRRKSPNQHLNRQNQNPKKKLNLTQLLSKYVSFKLVGEEAARAGGAWVGGDAGGAFSAVR